MRARCLPFSYEQSIHKNPKKPSMRSLLLYSALTAAVWFVAGCQQKQTVDESVQTYQCPTCKETVTWSYSSKQFGIAGRPVRHDCPTCKREWTGILSNTSTCATCGTEHLACPMCQSHK